MSIKAKLAAAVQRANEDPKKVNTIKKGYDTYSKNNNPVPTKQYNTIKKSTITVPSQKQYMASTMKKKEAPMSSMPTLRPTSVSVSAEKRTAAPLAGQAPMGKTKGRG